MTDVHGPDGSDRRTVPARKYTLDRRPGSGTPISENERGWFIGTTVSTSTAQKMAAEAFRENTTMAEIARRRLTKHYRGAK